MAWQKQKRLSLLSKRGNACRAVISRIFQVPLVGNIEVALEQVASIDKEGSKVRPDAPDATLPGWTGKALSLSPSGFSPTSRQAALDW